MCHASILPFLYELYHQGTKQQMREVSLYKIIPTNKEKGMTELGYHHLTILNEFMDLGTEHHSLPTLYKKRDNRTLCDFG